MSEKIIKSITIKTNHRFTRLENELAGWKKELSILENATVNIANNNFNII